ncbi:NAD-P-binding protein [Rhodocollybia butyracea]|uniref:NAD-P-binding protein n=1 Tax=Rhodocollybia butyracea TaxID=206335 RepID=A0A9P5PH76_9AGAR|nr:NAD-P-binding protein [Rhodocollybia butyracea]
MPAQRKTVTEDDLIDLQGKVAIVTGGNTGVGYATVQFLAEKGAKVYMGARNEEKATVAIEEIEAELPKDTNGNSKGSVHWLKLDLSDLRLVKEAGTWFLSKEERLDILVNNASHPSYGPYKLQDGLLDVMVVNHISHFELTETLLPLLKKTAALEGSDVRIVNVSSLAHTRVKPESFVGVESINKQFGDSVGGYLDTYGNSKLANILHIKHLQSQLKQESIPITCIAVHPGPVRTIGADGFLNSVPFVGWFLKWVVGPLFFVPWRQGAATSAFAAASKDVATAREAYEGAYLTPVAKISEPSSFAKDEKLQRELYETTRHILTELGL